MHRAVSELRGVNDSPVGEIHSRIIAIFSAHDVISSGKYNPAPISMVLFAKVSIHRRSSQDAWAV